MVTLQPQADIRVCLNSPNRQAVTAAAFAEAYRTGISVTQRFLLSRGCPADMAEELAQAAWTKGWQHLTQLRHPNLLVHWVNSIALNLRRGMSRTPMLLPLDERGHVPSLDKNIDLHRALAQLAAPDRNWVEGFYVEGLAIRELARKGTSSEGALRIRLHRIRKKMKQLLT